MTIEKLVYDPFGVFILRIVGSNSKLIKLDKYISFKLMDSDPLEFLRYSTR